MSLISVLRPRHVLVQRRYERFALPIAWTLAAWGFAWALQESPPGASERCMLFAFLHIVALPGYVISMFATASLQGLLWLIDHDARLIGYDFTMVFWKIALATTPIGWVLLETLFLWPDLKRARAAAGAGASRVQVREGADLGTGQG